MGIATKFAKWDVPALATLKGCKAYQLREQLNDGEKLSRADKNWLTEAINRNSYFRRDFTDAVHLYWVKQFRQIHEYYAIDKTSLRAILFGKVDEIVELI